jgi:hypothetical protein
MSKKNKDKQFEQKPDPRKPETEPPAQPVKEPKTLASLEGAVENLEQVAGKGVIIVDGLDMPPEERERMLESAKKHLPPIEVLHLHSEDEQAAVVALRRIASPGESLVQAVERLEALAARAVAAEEEVRKLSLDNGVLLGAQESALASPLRALEGVTRAVGVIVEDVEKEKHRILVLERGDGELKVWHYAKGEAMPWHAAKEVVDKLVETRLTPESKR